MSKYIETIPRGELERMAIVLGKGRSAEQVKKDTGCTWVVNGGLYDMGTGKPVAHLKADGQVLHSEAWGDWGYAWDTGADLEMRVIPQQGEAKANYLTCLALLTPWDGVEDKLSVPSALGGRRGRTAIAVKEDGTVVLYCSGDGTGDAKTPEELRRELYGMGAKTALMLDSGGSSQCDFGGGKVIRSSRRVHNYICLWGKGNKPGPGEKEEEKHMGKYQVCLDPGHGPGTENGAPDGSYKEREFAWDMAGRVKAALEARGVTVLLTRKEGEKPSLTARAKASNDAGAEAFVSLHSNASGSGWTSPSGLMIYTSTAGQSAGRNRMAKAILSRMEGAGVKLFGTGLSHYGYTVLTATTAPACLIEYGFHTNREDVKLLKDSGYRAKLAAATAQGICDYLGVAGADEDKEEGPGSGVADWAKDAWAKAAEKGVLDGTRPTEAVTRQELAVVLERCGVLG